MLPVVTGHHARSPATLFRWPSHGSKPLMLGLRPTHHHRVSLLWRLVALCLLGTVITAGVVFFYPAKAGEAPTVPRLQFLNLPRIPRHALETPRFFPAPELTRLVLVAGHSVFTALDFHLAAQEKSWYLESYQQVPGEAQSFIQHIKLGVESAAEDEHAMLMFSGGQTRRDAGPRSEASSYWQVAEALGWFNHTDVRDRAFTEEHARDSFENLLFGMCRFYELTGQYPKDVTVVSYALKEIRFSSIHRNAIHFPQQRFHFKGSPIPPGTKGAEEGEARTVAAFTSDPYSCSGELLAKKLKRDPFAVGPPHPSRCPSMQQLMTYCGTQLFGGHLPWDGFDHDSSSK